MISMGLSINVILGLTRSLMASQWFDSARMHVEIKSTRRPEVQSSADRNIPSRGEYPLCLRMADLFSAITQIVTGVTSSWTPRRFVALIRSCYDIHSIALNIQYPVARRAISKQPDLKTILMLLHCMGLAFCLSYRVQKVTAYLHGCSSSPYWMPSSQSFICRAIGPTSSLSGRPQLTSLPW